MKHALSAREALAVEAYMRDIRNASLKSWANEPDLVRAYWLHRVAGAVERIRRLGFRVVAAPKRRKR